MPITLLNCCLLLLISIYSCAQKPHHHQHHTIHEYADSLPEFPGGMEAFSQYLGNNMIYPKAAKAAEVEGVVETKVVIGKTGRIEDVIIVNGIGYGCDEEAIRVLKEMPHWKPASILGKHVAFSFDVPITFQLFKKKKQE